MFATMRSILAVASLLPAPAIAQDPATLPLQVSARMYETPLIGRAEILQRYLSQGTSAGDALADQSVVTVNQNATFQLTIDAVDANGNRQTMTGSPRLRYADSGCFTIGSGGLITVTPSNPSSCFVSSAFNTLFVTLLDEGQQQVVGWNSYNFKIE